MSKEVGAILLDTRSIQKYVFSCNKLKTNVGASYLVDGIFNDLMQKIVLPSFNLKMPEISWQESKQIEMIKDDSIEAEIVYIGGGNMLILINKFSGKEDNLNLCREIVKKWTLEILKKAPGLKTGAAIGMMDVERFKDSLDKMYVQLKQNQNTVLPQVDLPYTGLTLECNISGKTADTFDWADKNWIAKEVKAKTDAYTYASKKVRSEYKDILEKDDSRDKYDFASELEKIGCKEGESYISVIHIDGNNMGVKFSKCKDSQERKKLSLKVAQIVQNAFCELIKTIIAEYDSKAYAEALDMEKLVDKEGKKLLPIRPIIIGGDDITFVCPARVGIEYAKRFIEAVNKQDFLNDEQYERMSREVKEENKSMKLSKTMSCCGGVAIVPLKYPFFRAYQLAEHLCSSAKTKSRQDDSSLIDFAILYGEMTPSLEQLCRYQYVAPEGYLHYGPYYIKKNSDEDIADKSSINDLLSLKDKLKAKVASNKIKELRDVLTRDLHAQIRFLENCEGVRDIIKEECNTKDIEAKAFWQKKDGEDDLKTRYVDAIEIIDFTLPNKED